MEALLQWGLDLILAIQQIHGPVLDGIFRAITFMGEEEFYLILLPLLLIWTHTCHVSGHRFIQSNNSSSQSRITADDRAMLPTWQ